MSSEHRARMLEHQIRVRAALAAHESGEGKWMNPTTTPGTRSGTATAEPVAAGSPSPAEAESTPGTATTVGMETVLRQSASVGRLALALSKAQGEIKAPSKDKTATIPGKDGKRGYDYKYADLADVIDAYRPVTSKYGLAVVQPMFQRDGHLVLITRVIHESGEWIESELPMTVYQRPQEQGSAITYARRYAVSSLLGIAAEEDDDGKRAQDAQPRRQEEQEQAPVDGDSAAIIDTASELEQHTGKTWRELVRLHSEFSKDDATLWFEDPTERGYKRTGTSVARTNVPTTKWKAGVRRKLEDELRKAVEALTPVAEADVPF